MSNNDKYIAVYDEAKGLWAVPAIGKYFESKKEAEEDADIQNYIYEEMSREAFGDFI